MLAAAKAALTIVVGGVLLGTLLGRAADPKMRPPPEASWRAAAERDHAQPSAYPSVETAEMAIPFGGFAPEPDAVIAADWPEPDYDLDAELAALDAAFSSQTAVELAADTARPLAFSEAQRAGDAAERAVQDAITAATRSPAQSAISAP